MKKQNIPNKPNKLQVWIDARQKYHLSHAQIQMARELGLNPRHFGKLANQHQETWKAPLPQFIEALYSKQFGRTVPDKVVSIEESIKELERKKVARQKRKQMPPESMTDPIPVERD
jgi:hypothetical protein